jgi:thiamine-phosphate pyrophosphorylase
LVLTDPGRGFDLARQQAIWPFGAGFIERTFGEPPTPPTSPSRCYLATCTPRQARALGLNGLHWPQGRLKTRRRCQVTGLVETASAHTGLEIARARAAGIANVLVSPAFASNSPSAKRPLGPHRLAQLARAFPDCTLFALGGVDGDTIASLARSGIYGVALVSFTRKRSSSAKRDTH